MFAVVKVSIVFLKAQIANLSGTIRRSGNMEPTFPCGYSCLELSKVLPIMGQGAGHFAVICLLCLPCFVTWLHVFNFPTPISDVNMPQKKEHADKNHSLGRTNPPGSTNEIPLLALRGLSLHNPVLGEREDIPSRQVQEAGRGPALV